MSKMVVSPLISIILCRTEHIQAHTMLIQFHISCDSFVLDVAILQKDEEKLMDVCSVLVMQMNATCAT